MGSVELIWVITTPRKKNYRRQHFALFLRNHLSLEGGGLKTTQLNSAHSTTFLAVFLSSFIRTTFARKCAHAIAFYSFNTGKEKELSVCPPLYLNARISLSALVGSSTMWLSVYTVSAIIVSGAHCFACVIKSGIFAFLPFWRGRGEVFGVFFWGLSPLLCGVC